MSEELSGSVRLEFPFENCSFGFAIFHHAVNRLELCMVDAASTQILMSIGTFENIDQVESGYREFIVTFATAMRKIEWND